MQKIFLYDSAGRAIALLRNDGIVFSISGRALAFLDNEYLYSFSGRQIGTFEEGWIRDLSGACVLFAKGACGFAPIKPVCQVDPVPAVLCVPPVKPVPAVPFVKAIKSCGWSSIDLGTFFGR